MPLRRAYFPLRPRPSTTTVGSTTPRSDRMTDFYPEARQRRHHDARRHWARRPSSTTQESIAIATRVIRRARRCPSSSACRRRASPRCASLARDVMEAGAAGVMIGPPNTLQDRRPDRDLLSAGGRGDRLRRSVRPSGLSAHILGVVMTPGVIRRIVSENPLLRDAQARGLAGTGEDHDLARLRARGSMRHISILCGNGGLFLDFEMERGADGAKTGYAFPGDAGRRGPAGAPGSATRRTICSTRICRCCATSSSRASVWRCESTS